DSLIFGHKIRGRGRLSSRSWTPRKPEKTKLYTNRRWKTRIKFGFLLGCLFLVIILAAVKHHLRTNIVESELPVCLDQPAISGYKTTLPPLITMFHIKTVLAVCVLSLAVPLACADTIYLKNGMYIK